MQPLEKWLSDVLPGLLRTLRKSIYLTDEEVKQARIDLDQRNIDKFVEDDHKRAMQVYPRELLESYDSEIFVKASLLKAIVDLKLPDQLLKSKNFLVFSDALYKFGLQIVENSHFFDELEEEPPTGLTHKQYFDDWKDQLEIRMDFWENLEAEIKGWGLQLTKSFKNTLKLLTPYIPTDAKGDFIVSNSIPLQVVSPYKLIYGLLRPLLIMPPVDGKHVLHPPMFLYLFEQLRINITGIKKVTRGYLGITSETLEHMAQEVENTKTGKRRAKETAHLSFSELLYKFFHDTPILQVLEMPISYNIPLETRFEHHWIIAGTGHGKTQTLQSLILEDIKRVADGKATVIVIDSQGDLIRNISNLKLFAQGEPLHGELCLIDPTDIEWPVSLNLFDVGIERINKYPMLERERLVNGILELYDFVLGSLLSAELTQKQSLIFRYVTRLMLQIPNATIHTFRELMEPDGYEKYQPYISRLQGTARAFFETEFQTKEFRDTKRQVVRRLWGVLENQTFERMFSHPKNKLDLFTEMNAGRVILINTAKDLLKENGTQILGRFFIAMIAQAAQERATLPLDKRIATFCYIDECQDYLDRNIGIILEQARKFNVGMILAHQYIGQLDPHLAETFSANTSIKFAGGVSAKDARTLSSMLRTNQSFIEEQRKRDKIDTSFAVHIKNVTPHAVSLSFPFGQLEKEPTMTRAEKEAVVDQIRSQYATHYTEVHSSFISVDYETVDPDHVDTDPSS